MATGTPIKASIRRRYLQEVLRLVNELVQINESAYRQGISMDRVVISSPDDYDAINAMLTACGPATGLDGTGATIADKIVFLLYDAAVADGDSEGTITIDSVAYPLSNSHLTE
jgi:hypothetical protein